MRPEAPRVAALSLYPIKSAAGIDVDAITLDEYGAVGDRRWLIVDRDGVAITARTHHALVTVRPGFVGADRNGALLVEAPTQSPLMVDVPPPEARRCQVTVWDDAMLARDAGDAAAEWFSTVLGAACRLVHLDPAAQRPLRAKYAGDVAVDARRVAFSDGAPLLLLGLPAIQALNDRLQAEGRSLTVDRRRFRANLWLDGLAPHAEDHWRHVRIGDVDIGVGTRCPRCVFTTVDPDTGATGAEPMRTLARYRLEEGKVVFGVNATHAAAGTVRCGDLVTVMARR